MFDFKESEDYDSSSRRNSHITHQWQYYWGTWEIKFLWIFKKKIIEDSLDFHNPQNFGCNTKLYSSPKNWKAQMLSRIHVKLSIKHSKYIYFLNPIKNSVFAAEYIKHIHIQALNCMVLTINRTCIFSTVCLE